MKTALVLSGGGSRGAFQVGMLDVLVRNKGIDFDIIRGVSVGALNGAFLAQADTGNNSLENLSKYVDRLIDLWMNQVKGDHSIYAYRVGSFAGFALGADSLFSLKPLENLIKKNVDYSKIAKSGREFKVGTVSLVSGEYNEWDSKEPGFDKKVLASASIPVIFPYVDLKDNEDVLVDGGVRNISPLESAILAGADEIYLLLASKIDKPKEPDKIVPNAANPRHTYENWDDDILGLKVGGMDVLGRTVEILTDEVYLGDIRRSWEWNQIAESIRKLEVAQEASNNMDEQLNEGIREVSEKLKSLGKRSIKLYVLAPQKWFNPNSEDIKKINSATKFCPELIAQAINHGREIARNPDFWLLPK